MIVEVLVSAGDADDPLHEHGGLIVLGEFGAAGIWDDCVKGVDEAEFARDFSQEERSGVGGEGSAVEVGDDGFGVEGGEGEVC